ncbi:MAG: hypothetical protein ABUS79_02405 [Pseudomonadota bacterium]
MADNGVALRLQSRDHTDEISMEAVQRIRVERSIPALVFGLLLGAVAGLAVGAAFESSSPPCMPSDSCLGLDFSGFPTAAGGIVGVVTGGVAGIIIGRGTTFTLSHPTPANGQPPLPPHPPLPSTATPLADR